MEEIIKDILSGKSKVEDIMGNKFYEDDDGWPCDENWDARNNLAKTIGLKASKNHINIVRDLLVVELNAQENEAENDELLRYLCCLLFLAGHITDSTLIWEAKSTSFDNMCGIDIQLLCGAGLEETVDFLSKDNSEVASDALEYLKECIESGDFQNFTVSDYKDYLYKYYNVT